jgi:hypothetical protein
MLRAGGTMKGLVKLVADFIAWRWAPAVSLLTASMLYVLVVVGLVPSEIGVPIGNAKLEAREFGASTPGQLEASDTTPYVASHGQTTPVSAPPRPAMRAPARDFGRRGFSPRLDRPEPLGNPSPPAVVSPPPQGLFSRLQGVLRPGSVAAQTVTQAAQVAAPTPPAPPPAPAAQPQPPAPEPADANQQQPPDAQQPAAPPGPEGAAPPPEGAAPTPPGAAPPGAPPPDAPGAAAPPPQ